MNEKDLMNALNEIDDDLLVFEEKRVTFADLCEILKISFKLLIKIIIS